MRHLPLVLLIGLILFPFTDISGIELDIQQYRLKNGLTLLVLEDHSAPVVSYQVFHISSNT
jgi:hypothetical protein